MDKIVLMIMLVFLGMSTKAQETRYQTYSTSLTILATKNGQNEEWRNKDLQVVLNYKTGKFIAQIKGSDFTNHQNGLTSTDEAEVSPDKIFKLSGIFPVDAMTNQQTTTASYEVELQLTNEDDSLFETILFNVTVTKPGDGAAKYRLFVLKGILYADDLQLPAFKGMDNQINLQLFFNAYWQN